MIHPAKLKVRALQMRKRGASITKIRGRLHISKSTLHEWFKNIKLTKRQIEKLRRNSLMALALARRRAVFWHHEQKRKRLKEAKNAAQLTLNKINETDMTTLELALAILYLGEGSKANTETAIGSSDPMILKFFLSCLTRLYNFDITKIRCELYLRWDQNPNKIKRYWSNTLRLPLHCFKGINMDKRTEKKLTYTSYKGVCNLRCGSVAIQRKLVYLARGFCEKVAMADGRLAQR